MCAQLCHDFAKQQWCQVRSLVSLSIHFSDGSSGLVMIITPFGPDTASRRSCNSARARHCAEADWRLGAHGGWAAGVICARQRSGVAVRRGARAAEHGGSDAGHGLAVEPITPQRWPGGEASAGRRSSASGRTRVRIGPRTGQHRGKIASATAAQRAGAMRECAVGGSVAPSRNAHILAPALLPEWDLGPHY
jgi:hypothetical protein